MSEDLYPLRDSEREMSARETGALELEPATGRYVAPARDRRPFMPEPPPVRLVAVEDVLVEAPAGVEPALDDFYVAMLQLEREDATVQQHGRPRTAHQSHHSHHSQQEDRTEIVYKAENVRLRMAVREPPVPRPDMRPIGVEVRSLADAEAKIIGREMEYERLRGLLPGQDSLMLRDPAGNWVAIVESREMR